MERVRRIGIVCCCCLILLTTGPIAGAARSSAPAGESAATGAAIVADGSAAGNHSGIAGSAQPATACFDDGGTEFVVGPQNGTHIWVRLHAGPLTGSGGAIGAETIGSIGGSSIIEIIAGLRFAGDGLADLLSSPGESVELIRGFDFQLPILEAITGEFTASGSNGTADAANDSSIDGGGKHGGYADDSRFEMLRC